MVIKCMQRYKKTISLTNTVFSAMPPRSAILCILFRSKYYSFLPCNSARNVDAGKLSLLTRFALV